MRQSRAATAAAGLVLVGLLTVSLHSVGPVPPLGPFLDPIHGVWSVAPQASAVATGRAPIPGLTAPVSVVFDDRAVPHIFAHSELDAVRALGYVVARDRLFQLELQARGGAGRLTELLGADALPLDREMRQLGLPDAAARRMAALTPVERQLVDAFADGANAWIDRLTDRQVPLEYHLVGRRPTRWAPINSLHLLNRMSLTLARSDLETAASRARARVGDAAADAIYPVNSPIQEPVQPNGQSAPRFDLLPVPAPSLPAAGGTLAPSGEGQGEASLRPVPSPDLDGIGSNNWAVAPNRTAAGYALLAGDPHLELTLPSIWYEAHLVVPDSLDVYGVTIPGAPGIIIGFTRDVAWSLTNAEADVLDRYVETVDHATQPTRYQLDGTWHALREAVDTFYGKQGELLALDTVRFSHRGPLHHDPVSGSWLSLRWTALESGDELTLFGRAARAVTAEGWLDSMSRYRAPAQNLLVADRQGGIAIRTTGRFPIRPAGRGDVPQPGATSDGDWTGNWAIDDLPQARNPAQGYLASANQQPIDPQVNPRYLGANWYSPWRAIRMNQLLRQDSAVTPDAMRRYQTDPGSPAADLFVPALLAAARQFPDRDSVQRAAALLQAWDRRYTLDNTGAALYEEAIRQLQAALWDELRAPPPGDARLPTPGLAVTASLLQEPGNAWWDDRGTPAVEGRNELLANALSRALGEMLRRHGDPAAGGWRWDGIRFANIRHLLGIGALSALRIPVAGGQGTLNPSTGSGGFGPSWRMVVEMGPEVRAWGTYPGGQSGNPASARYLDHLARWREGDLDMLRFPRTAAELSGRASGEFRLEPPGSP